MAEKLFRLAVLLLVLLCLAAGTAEACGPNFPNNLLDAGDDAVLRAPGARFRDELERMQLMTSRFSAKPATNGYEEQALEAELNDLAAALRQANRPPELADTLWAAHRAQRQKLKSFVAEYDAWAGSGRFVWDENGGKSIPPEKPAPKFAGVVVPTGLPPEFALYLVGAAAWQNPADEKQSMARDAWERLLELPVAERKFKSTWAAYMLGKYWEDEDAAKATGYFQKVRELARRGFVDSIGLAAASLGWEARLCLKEKKYREAIELYLEQMAAGDDSAVASLRIVASAALNEPTVLPELAKVNRAQKVLTACLIAGQEFAEENAGGEDENGTTASANWLKAVEAAGVADVDSAEKLALAAYQAGDFGTAQRWTNRAKESPVAQWLQAKLLLRAGKMEPGAALLAKVAARWPVADETPPGKQPTLADSLYSTFENSHSPSPSAAMQVLGELGVLHLRSGKFILALDGLLRADFWGDAAYVAERVLTTDELKDYVDQNWPAPQRKRGPQSRDEREAQFCLVEKLREDIRYLLARRLTRELRGNEARPYYPSNWLPHFDALVEALQAGWDESLTLNDRARALFRAAWRVRTNGMELVGTEVSPDYHIWLGDFEYGVDGEARGANLSGARLNLATTNELQRVQQHEADPERRFHYRYQAAFIAAHAARLMPDNTEETALMLCTAGTWLKDRDPETADVFYKSLVRRCRQTALGAEADRRRWFPPLDANGQFTPQPLPAIEQIEFSLDDEQPIPETEEGDAVEPRPPPPTYRGLNYTVEPGDTLYAILNALRQRGVTVSLEDLMIANPGMVPTRMAVGSSIIIPLEPLPQADGAAVEY